MAVREGDQINGAEREKREAEWRGREGEKGGRVRILTDCGLLQRKSEIRNRRLPTYASPPSPPWSQRLKTGERSVLTTVSRSQGGTSSSFTRDLE